MKTNTLISCFLCFIALSAGAQSPGFRYGPRFGFGEASFRNIDAPQQSKLAVNAGISACMQFNNFFGLESGVSFVNKGARVSGFKEDGADFWGNPQYYSYQDVFDLAYAEIPLTAKLSLGFGSFHIKGFAGPGVGFNLYSTQSRLYDNAEYNMSNGFSTKLNNLEVAELAAIYGTGIEIENPSGQLFYLELRLSDALSSFGKVEGKAARNSYYCISAGYMFK